LDPTGLPRVVCGTRNRHVELFVESVSVEFNDHHAGRNYHHFAFRSICGGNPDTPGGPA
jgi:hypothetical protein